MTSPETIRTPTTREAHRVDAADAARRVERWSEGSPGLAASYPQVFHPLGRGQVFGLHVQEQPVCHAATHAVRINTPDGPIDAVLVGSVATDPEARKQGLATELVGQLIDHARAVGRDAVLLWSDLWGFYERLGFAPAGRQTEIIVRARCDTFVAGIRPANAGDLPSILALHHDKPIAVDRDLHDLALQLSIRPMTTMVLERDAHVVAYAICGKGVDFVGWWHEFGGGDDDVALLVRGAMDLLQQSEATLMVPPYRERLRGLFQRSTLSENPGAGALRCALTPRGEVDLFVDGLDSI